MRHVMSNRWRGSLFLALVGGALTAAGCADDLGGPVDADAAFDLDGGGGDSWDLPLLGPGALAREFPASPCRDARHGEFDFWVGDWNVTSTAGTQIGTNIVTSELDGCLVMEHWTAGTGSRGLSLNTFDRETGMWHQTWASQVPQGILGRLRTAGGLEDGKMVLAAVRNATGGFTFLDNWTWEENDAGQVIQSALTVVPEFGLRFPFTGIYTRGDVVPAPELGTAFCADGAVGGETRLADFLVGRWRVSAENGPFLGVASIESDLRDCLFVERFESRGGLRATSFTYVDLWVERWFRTYVDSEGERLELEGAFEDGALVLRGTEATNHGPVDVVVTWRPDGANVRQEWQVSRDGGVTWQNTVTLIYSPA